MREEFSIQREYPRHKVMQRALVLVNQNLDALPFHIVDVSKGGLAFRYLGSHSKRSNSGKINLYHESELIVEGLPVKPVSDSCLRESPVPLRRGSFRFEKLNSEQDALVDRFINLFTDQSPLSV